MALRINLYKLYCTNLYRNNEVIINYIVNYVHSCLNDDIRGSLLCSLQNTLSSWSCAFLVSQAIIAHSPIHGLCLLVVV